MTEQNQTITGKAIIAGVMGWPVAHSRSPLLHNYWLRRYGINGAYVPLAVDPVGLPSALRALSALGFAGCNITVPHKESALALVDSVDALAKKVGAINTVIVKDGKLIGSNTDVYGFTTNLETAGKAWNKKKPALVVGAGGAARAVIIALAQSGCSDIRITNRTNDRAIALAKEMNEAIKEKSSSLISRPSSLITPVAWQDRDDAMRDCATLINTTTQGMQGQPPLDINLRALDDHALVTDLVYTPLLTPLLIEARRRNHPIVDGLGMLLHQAVPGFHAWYGVKPEVDETARQLLLADITKGVA
ncbi:MAG: shikimate dehydrogenase [Alphaproteobacteria bacterium]|nr:shikimate dehydrogenase [Alphaproteobacteria bacterium]